MRIALILGLLASASLITACSANDQTQVEKAQQHLQEVRAESARNIQRAEVELNEVIAKTTAKLESARRDLAPTSTIDNQGGTASGTTSGTTSGMTTGSSTTEPSVAQ